MQICFFVFMVYVSGGHSTHGRNDMHTVTSEHFAAITTRAAGLGWTLAGIAAIAVNEFVIVCHNADNTATPYTTWRAYIPADGSGVAFNHGNYTADESTAWKDFAARVAFCLRLS
jgi:hypothetical protein